mmetsp:Transcript_45/g.182  ORF Transcript_45/g.182 Transcript_45/m.182 type:complete len:263 (-) Transcript_45:355-1143(-)
MSGDRLVVNHARQSRLNRRLGCPCESDERSLAKIHRLARSRTQKDAERSHDSPESYDSDRLRRDVARHRVQIERASDDDEQKRRRELGPQRVHKRRRFLERVLHPARFPRARDGDAKRDARQRSSAVHFQPFRREQNQQNHGQNHRRVRRRARAIPRRGQQSRPRRELRRADSPERADDELRRHLPRHRARPAPPRRRHDAAAHAEADYAQNSVKRARGDDEIRHARLHAQPRPLHRHRRRNHHRQRYPTHQKSQRERRRDR